MPALMLFVQRFAKRRESMNKISVKNVSYVYSPGTTYKTDALSNVSVDFEAGKTTGLIGHTGSGKSTLVQMLNGLLKPASGEILIDGKNIWDDPKSIGKVRFRVGLVMQYPEYQLFEETVEKDIAFGPKNMGMTDEQIERCVKSAAQTVGLDEAALKKSPFDLSGGQKRRVAIAGVMAMEPEVLVLDEPAAGLDPEGRRAIFSAISDYQKKTGATVIIVSHSMEDMADWCDNIVVMANSKVFISGTRDEVFSRSSELASVGLDIPQITKLMIQLKERGIDADVSAYTVNAAYKSLVKLFG